MVEPYAARVAIAYGEASEHAPAHEDWYALARAEARAMATANSATLAAACGVIAALSPREFWHRNLVLARDVLAGRQVRTMRHKHAAALRIVAGERPLDMLNGPKVRAFYRNLMGDTSAVTVDVHAARAAGHTGRVDARSYPALERAYQNVGQLVGVEPSAVQSAVWMVQRAGGQLSFGAI